MRYKRRGQRRDNPTRIRLNVVGVELVSQTLTGLYFGIFDLGIDLLHGYYLLRIVRGHQQVELRGIEYGGLYYIGQYLRRQHRSEERRVGKECM